MKLNDIPVESRTISICINRMKQAIRSGTLDQMHEVLELIPKEILIASYVKANINQIMNIPSCIMQKPIEQLPRQARTETVCLNAMKTAIDMDQWKGIEHVTKVMAFIPREMLITAFVRANISDFS
jgi:hypothetical protein